MTGFAGFWSLGHFRLLRGGDLGGEVALDFFMNGVEEFFAITLRLIGFSFAFVAFFMNVVWVFFIKVGLHEDTAGFDDFLGRC